MVDIAIAGLPRAGKTTLSVALSGGDLSGVRRTDSLIDLGWSESSEAASHWFDDPGVRIVEGVAVLRALRKWLARNPTGAPCSRVVFLGEARVPLVGGQRGMATAITNLMGELGPALRERGVSVEVW